MPIILPNNPEETMRKFRKHIMKNALISDIPSVRERVDYLPICPQCERPALRDTRKYDPVQAGYITCPECGYHGPGTHPVKYHIENHVIPEETSRRQEAKVKEWRDSLGRA